MPDNDDEEAIQLSDDEWIAIMEGRAVNRHAKPRPWEEFGMTEAEWDKLDKEVEATERNRAKQKAEHQRKKQGFAQAAPEKKAPPPRPVERTWSAGGRRFITRSEDYEDTRPARSRYQARTIELFDEPPYERTIHGSPKAFRLPEQAVHHEEESVRKEFRFAPARGFRRGRH